MAQGGGLADASVGGEYAQARISDELTEGAFEFFEPGALVEEGFALGIFGKRMVGKTKALAIHVGSFLLFLGFLGGGQRLAHRADAVVVLGFDQGERIEAAGLSVRGRFATHAPPSARSIRDAVERHGVAEEGIFDEDARARRVVVGIEARFHFLALESGPNFQIASPEADGAIFADRKSTRLNSSH